MGALMAGQHNVGLLEERNKVKVVLHRTGDYRLTSPGRCSFSGNRNRNRKLQTSKAPLQSQAQGTRLFTSTASNQRGFPKNSPWEAQVRFPEGERMRQIRGVFQRIVRGKLRSGCQKVRGGRLGVKAGVV